MRSCFLVLRWIIELFSLEGGEETLLFVGLLGDAENCVAHSGNGGGDRVIIEVVLGDDDRLLCLVGGLDLLHRELASDGVVNVRLTHGAHHSFYFYGDLEHGDIPSFSFGY